MIVMLRSREQITMKKPAVNIMVDAIFLESLRPDFHRSGTGMDMRYKSVDAFRARFVQMTGIDRAGWQESGKDGDVSLRVRGDLQRFTYCRGQDLFASICERAGK